MILEIVLQNIRNKVSGWNAICVLFEISILEFGFQNNDNSLFVAIYMAISISEFGFQKS